MKPTTIVTPILPVSCENYVNSLEMELSFDLSQTWIYNNNADSAHTTRRPI
jgi:hypothetical protein